MREDKSREEEPDLRIVLSDSEAAAQIQDDLANPENLSDEEFSTAGRIEQILLQGVKNLDLERLEAQTGCPEEFIRNYWRAMGFAQPAPHEAVFTQMDARAMRSWQEAVKHTSIDDTTSQSLIRAQSHLADRLALWQVEAFVEDLMHRYALDDTTARLLVLDRIPQFLGVMEEQLRYAWRRQMAALLQTMFSEVALRGREEEDPDAYPLDRTLGFVDMVSYTSNVAKLGSHELAHLIQTFELVARDVVTSLGGRVVKTIGDCVLFVANKVLTGADIACALVEEIENHEDLLTVRASLVHGRVVSRSGDIFGPPVNLASRIADVAQPGQILMDADSARDLSEADRRREFETIPALTAELRGVGAVDCVELRRRDREN